MRLNGSRTARSNTRAVIDRSCLSFQPASLTLNLGLWLSCANPKKRAQYIALSRSWGGHHPIATTTSTLLEYKKGGININALPKTYRDAIGITRRLGHRYIWITQNRFVNSAAKRDQMHARWRSLVEEYSRRRLTVGTDRLPAFAGLATEMQGYLGQRYFAGL